MHWREVRDAGADIVLGNTYHLMLRPSAERIAALGGLQKFTGWNGPMLTDSGGFQVMSLSDLRKVSENAVTFRSHIDGAKVELRGWKWVKVSADASTRIDVATVCDAPLDAYLRLPAEEYALLDPKFVSRTSPTTFTFAVPLKSTLPAETSEGPASVLRELTPSIDFTTETGLRAK